MLPALAPPADGPQPAEANVIGMAMGPFSPPAPDAEAAAGDSSEAS